jgi:glutamate 5-kinase
MVTKVEAAHVASRSGVTTVIAAGGEPEVLTRVVRGEAVGTRFEAVNSHMESRKRWLLTDRSRGALYVDGGAARALTQRGASLLPVGVTAAEGEFQRGATVSVMAPDRKEVAHGLTNYSSAELRRLCGVKSTEIADVLGYSYGDYVIHRNNMVLLT